MLRKSLFSMFAVMALLSAAFTASAQTGELRGHVIMNQADGTKIPAPDVIIDVFRTDIKGTYNTKTNKKGEFVFAGLPYVGDYTIGASHPSARPTYLPGVKVGRGTDYEISLVPGDGKRLTIEEIKAAEKNLGSGASGAPAATSAGDKAKMEELARKNAELTATNKKIEESNELIQRTFKAGNDAFAAKDYDAAIAHFDEGLKADPDHPGIQALLTNKAIALRTRGVDRYNKAVKIQDDAAKSAAIQAAKQDWKDAAEAASTGVAKLKAEGVPADPALAGNYKTNLYFALAARSETMRLFVKMVDPGQADAGAAAFEEYIAVETDPVKKTKAERDLAQLLFDAGSLDKAQVEYKKMLAKDPNDPDALANMGMILFNVGATKDMEGKKEEAKAVYQEAANYLQQFVDKAPDDNVLKAGAKEVLDNLKEQQNVKAEKTATPARRRRP